jgi:hypothetical protein
MAQGVADGAARLRGSLGSKSPAAQSPPTNTERRVRRPRQLSMAEAAYLELKTGGRLRQRFSFLQPITCNLSTGATLLTTQMMVDYDER